MKKSLEPRKSIRISLPREVKGPSLRGGFVWMIVVWVGALIGAVALFLFARNLTACWQLTALPGIRPAFCSGGGDQLQAFNVSSTPGSAAAPPAPSSDVSVPAVEYPAWDGGSRINIVFFGLRGGDASGENCPLCTDTIIVFTLDPVTKTAGMISVPRDLFVNIPGFGFSRINTAWTTGVAARLPGGGPGLAMKTVSQFLGVPVQYYVQVDFGTFVSFVNLIGGIDVYNTDNLLLSKLGGGQDKIKITCCGMRHLTGQVALAYARCRDVSQGCSNDDVGRSQRQQKVIMAIRQKIFDPKEFATLMAQAPQLYILFSSGIHTNLTLDEAIKLAVLAKDVSLAHIRQGVIDYHMTNMGTVVLAGQKASIVMPIPDKVRDLRDQIFMTGGSTSPMARGGAEALMQADGARVRIVNNSGVRGLDSRTANFLLGRGMQVTALAQPNGSYGQTLVIVYSPKLYALRYLVSPLGMIRASNQILFKPDSTQGVDLEIRLGSDWVSKLAALGG